MKYVKLDFTGRYDPLYITPEYYEEIKHTIITRSVLGDSSPGDNILANLILSGQESYEKISGWCVHTGELSDLLELERKREYEI